MCKAAHNKTLGKGTLLCISMNFNIGVVATKGENNNTENYDQSIHFTILLNTKAMDPFETIQSFAWLSRVT